MKRPILAGLALAPMLCGCTSAQIQTANADFQAACADWSATKGGIEAVAALNPVATTVVAYVGDACDIGSPLAATATALDVAWLQTSTANLKATK